MCYFAHLLIIGRAGEVINVNYCSVLMLILCSGLYNLGYPTESLLQGMITIISSCDFTRYNTKDKKKSY